MPFAKGQSGNPGGRPKELAGVQKLAREHATMAIGVLANVAKKGVSESARVSAASALLDRGYGKPPQFTTGNSEQFKRAVDMTDDELAAIASGSGPGAPGTQESPKVTH